MTGLLNMIGFEYKKILMRKSFILAIIIMLFMSTLALVADVYLSVYTLYDEERPAYEVIQEENEGIHKVAGYLDTDMIKEVAEHNASVNQYPMGTEAPKAVYESSIYPYSRQRSIIAQFISPNNYTSKDSFHTPVMTADELYALREKNLIDSAKRAGYSDAEIKDLAARNTKLSSPFYFDAFDGYRTLIVQLSVSAVFIVFSLTICIAPVFADEYQKRTDALILSSKHGKNKLILAKLITIVSFSFIYTAVALGISALSVFITYGTYGSDTSYQFFQAYSVYPLTMLKATLVYFGVILVASLFVSAIVAFLSARTNSFTTIIVTTILLIGSMFFSIPFKSLQILNNFLPGKMMASDAVFSDRLVNVFGMYVPPYVFMSVVCVILMVILLPWAYRGFKRHQI